MIRYEGARPGTRARAFALLALLTACQRVAEPPCAVLITLDTTRADALGVYGGRPGVTPALDAFAAECATYLQARTVAPVTLPAHASMMTGLVPPRHTVRDNALRPLPEEARTLAEIAREGGCETAAFVAASVLERAWGLAQGFDVYDQPSGEGSGPGFHIGERRAGEVVAAASSWLSKRDRDRPYLLWVHLFEPHAPYDPPPDALAAAGGNAYLGEVAAMDRAVGDLLAALRRDPAWPRTTVLVVADHGESLGEKGEPTHSILCHRPVIRVPLLVRRPGAEGAGERREDVAGVVDVLPTLAEALGLSGPEGIDGRSLLRGSLPEDRGVYFESYVGYLNHGWSPIVGFADRRGVLVQSASPALYAAEGDPTEATNLAAERPAEVERYRAEIARVAARPSLPVASAVPLDEEGLAKIRALGYAGAGDPEAELPAPLAATGLPGPEERTAELRDYYAALLEANAGKPEAAIAGLRAIVRANPRDVAALDALGSLLVDGRRHAEAIPVLEGIRATGARRITTYTSLGRCYEATGDLDRALECYVHAEELKPGAVDPIRDVVRVLRAAGRESETEAWLRKLGR